MKKVNDLIAESMLNPVTPDLQEFVFVFYIEANAILWNYLSKEPCSKVCLVKWTDSNKQLFDSMIIYKGDKFYKPFKLKITSINGNKDSNFEFEDASCEFKQNFPNDLNEFVDLFVKAIEYPSKIW